MVMEAPPSPQSVGREFVRQYYTLLNKAPTHLHRFYNNQSSFVHGGLDRETSPVIGQKQIHQKIQQLNFRDCHAKITQVDSQATLGSGVVVQVTGELSNAGQPMRRFTQTFVLASQSPKKYYVHNDIFRYQDEIISDEDCDADTRSDPEEDVVAERQVLDVQQQINQQPLPPYYQQAAPIPGQVQQQQHHHTPQPQHVMPQPVPVPTVNGAVHPEDLNVLGGPIQQSHAPQNQQLGGGPIQTLQQPIVPQQPQQPIQADEPQLTHQDEVIEETNDAYNDGLAEPEQDQEIVTENVISNEPKTWANLLKSPSDKASPYGGNHPSLPSRTIPIVDPNSGNVYVVRQNKWSVQQQQQQQRVPAGVNNQPPQQQQQPPQQQARVPRQDTGRSGFAPRNDDLGIDERRRSQGMPFNNDVNQLFLGNLPHAATEDDLRDIFNDFGTIVDLRVHSKPQSKTTPGARATPNYGFITYESQSSVQACLESRPIFYPKDDKNGVMLNVEEKKLKDKQPYSNNRPNSDNRGPRGDNGPRRMGPGGPNRGSMGGPGGPANNGPNRNYNRTGGGGPPNRGGPNNTYNNRR